MTVQVSVIRNPGI